MTPAETEQIYTAACRAYRVKPQDDEGRKWHKVLREYELRDVRAGFDAWCGLKDLDSKGDVKSKWLPQPSELAPLVERAARERQARDSKPQLLVIWMCVCKFTCSGFVPEGETRKVTCRKCGAGMTEMHRGKAA